MRFIVTATFVVDDQEDVAPTDLIRQFSLGYMGVTGREDMVSRTYEPTAIVVTTVDADLDHRTMVDGYSF